MILIGLNGLKRAGKDTTCDYILAEAALQGVVGRRAAFADRLKAVALESLGGSPVLADEFKETGQVVASYEEELTAGTFDMAVTGRQFLQNLGAAGRNHFGSNFWLDQVLPPTHGGMYLKYGEAQLLVVTDVRYDNEARRVLDLGGEVWCIDRIGGISDGHASEQALPSDLISLSVSNHADLGSLEEQVRLLTNITLDQFNVRSLNEQVRPEDA
jgi:hypothetical protein